MAPFSSFSGISLAAISRLNSSSNAIISEVDDINFPSLGSSFIKNLFLYTFDGEDNGTGNMVDDPKWVPSSFMEGVTGTDCEDHVGINLSNTIIWRNQNIPQHLTVNQGSPDHTTNLTPGTFFSAPGVFGGAGNFTGSEDGDSTLVGWNCLVNEQTTSAATGPSASAVYPYTDASNSEPIEDSGSMNLIPDTDESFGGFLYTEASSLSGFANIDERVFMTAFCAYGLTQLMNDQNNNRCLLKFMCHAKGSTMGDLGVFSSTSDRFQTTTLVSESIGSDGGFFQFYEETYPNISQFLVNISTNYKELAFFTGEQLQDATDNLSDPLKKYFDITIDLQELLNIEINNSANKYHWIYFIFGNATGFNSDFAIDNVRVEEHTP